jgi:hypothetical protein
MASVIGEERRDLRRSVRGVIIDEFCQREELIPVVLLIVAIKPEILLQGLVHSFRLTIRLGMIGRRPVSLDIALFQELASKTGRELLSSVGYYVDWETVVLEHIPEV